MALYAIVLSTLCFGSSVMEFYTGSQKINALPN